MHSLPILIVTLSLLGAAISQSVPQLINELPSCSLSCFQSNVPTGCSATLIESDLLCRCTNRFEVQSALIDCINDACSYVDRLSARSGYLQICNALEDGAETVSSAPSTPTMSIDPAISSAASRAIDCLTITAGASASACVSEVLAEVTGAVGTSVVGTGGAAASSSAAQSSSNDGGSSMPVGAIAGGVVGGVVALAIIGILVFFLLRARRRAATAEAKRGEKGSDDNDHDTPNVRNASNDLVDAHDVAPPTYGAQIDADEERRHYGFRDEKASYVAAVDSAPPAAGPDDVGSSAQHGYGSQVAGHELDSTQRYELPTTR